MPVNVYYLDDEEVLCEIFSEILSSQHIVVTTFSNSNEAIDACRKKPPDILFIDYRLPGVTGDLVAIEIDKDIPKILVTGDLSYKSKYNFEKIISKPCDFGEVRKIISEYL